MDYGKKTYIYWNLHKLTFSIMQNQKVVGHSNQLYLSDVEFRVRERGRQKVLKDRVENVHAFVVIARALQDTRWNPVSHASMVGLTNHQGKPLIQSKNNVIIS